MSDFTTIVDSLEKLSAAASSAYKYGPFFFAIPLILMPFVARAVFKSFFGKDFGARRYKEAYRDFRFYARSTVIAGLICVGVGVAWWVFENYTFNKKMQVLIPELQNQLQKLEKTNEEKQYAIVGAIVNGFRKDAELMPMMSQQTTIYFSRVLGADTLYFTILSDEKIPTEFEIPAMYAELDQLKRNIEPDPRKTLQIQLKLHPGKRFGFYRFVHSPQSTNATIVPTVVPSSATVR